MDLPGVNLFVMEKMMQAFAFSLAWHYLFGQILSWTGYVEEAVK